MKPERTTSWHFSFLGIDSTADEAVGLQSAEGLCEHFLGAVGVGSLNVLESQGCLTAAQCIDYCQRPFAADACQHIADGAFGENGLFDEVLGHIDVF